MIFVGDDWAEDHHDVEILDEAGARLARRRFPEGGAGVGQLHALIAEHATEPAAVAVGIETDRGLWVSSLVAAGYQVYAVNPKSVARYRERHAVSGAKSDPGDAKVLADLVRTDRHVHRTVAGDSEGAEAVKVLARAQQRLIWDRQRHLNNLRSTLREFYPAALVAFGTELAHPDALAVLGRAPTPAEGRKLSAGAIEAALRRGGRKRNVAERALAIREALRSPQLDAPAAVSAAFGATVRASVAIVAEMTRQLGELEAEMTKSFVLSRTRTPRSWPACQGSVWSSAPGCWASSGTTRTAIRMADAVGTTPAPRPLPRPRARSTPWWPASSATATWPTPATCGPSAPSPPRRGRGRSTTSTGPRARATTRP